MWVKNWPYSQSFHIPSHAQSEWRAIRGNDIFIVSLLHEIRHLEFVNCSICWAFPSKAGFSQQLYIFFLWWESDFLHRRKKPTKRNNRNLFVPLSDSDCCCWCWGYLTEQQCKFPYLAENMDSSSTTTWGSKHSIRAGPRAAGWSKRRPGYRLCRSLLATQLRILPSYDLPALRSLEAFTAAELRPRLGFTRSLRPRVIPLYAQTVRGPRYALREARHVCLREWSLEGTLAKFSQGPSDMLD